MYEIEVNDGYFKRTIVVDEYEPELPMRVTGWGFGDAEPGQPEYMSYRVFEDGEEYDPPIHERWAIEKKIREHLGVDNGI